LKLEEIGLGVALLGAVILMKLAGVFRVIAIVAAKYSQTYLPRFIEVLGGAVCEILIALKGLAIMRITIKNIRKKDLLQLIGTLLLWAVPCVIMI
jgi:hypothetical protein